MIDSSVLSSGPTGSSGAPSAFHVIIAVLLVVPIQAAAVWDILKDAGGVGDGLSPLERGEHPPQSALVMQLKLPQCRDDCMEKFNAVDDLRCLQNADCSHCVGRCTNPLVAGDDENRIPDAPLPVRHPPYNPIQLSRQRLVAPGTPGMPAESIRLRIESLVRDRALVSADIRWRWPREWKPRLGGHCLVTWDVAGGGLMGNLLTDVPEAELTLWPLTVYHIQVTCKCKENGQMFKALPLTIDTSKAIDILDLPSTTSATTTSIIQTTQYTRTTPQTSPSTTMSNLIPRKSSATYKPLKDNKKLQVLQLLEQQHYDLSVQSNEILPPHPQHRTSALAQNPAQTSTSRTQLPVGRSSRLRLELLLGLCLAGTGSLAVYWVFLSGRYAAGQVVSLSPLATGKLEPKSAKDEKDGRSVWLATCNQEESVDRKCKGGGGPEVPLMRVMHV